MKSIAEFVAGKIRRSEVEDALAFEPGGAAHPELGPREGELIGPGGRATLYARGFTLSESTVSYEEIEWVSADAEGLIVKLGDRTIRVRASEAGGPVLLATLRWIGHTRLRRKIAD